MAATKADLDAAITALQADIITQTTAIDKATQAIIDAIAAAGAPIDLTAEVTQLQAAGTALDTIAGQLPKTVSAPPPAGASSK